MTLVSELRLGRVFLLGIGVFVVSFLFVTLIITVYAFALGFEARGAPDQAEIQRFASNVAPWAGPVISILLTLVAALWTARRVPARRALHGLLLGAVVGLLILAVGSTGETHTTDLLGAAMIVAIGWVGGVLGAGRSKSL